MKRTVTKSIIAGCLAILASVPVTVAAGGAATVAPDDVTFTDLMVATPVSATPGDPARGAKVFVSRSLGNCLACHEVTVLKKELFHGTVGPSLDGAASRWSVDQLRAIVVDAKKVFGPETVMPGFYSNHVGLHVDEKHAGKTILTADQVEDVVAFLATLKD
ncbi:sulfur oxidation c-type cytochrome SoxX [Rhodospirillum sp. A1_3_36]|uniref:sulfur oxidation c-type cytochrome SoxX n=1 Tax=Rhodospirillum sp. A1_3_36 TaxID=3391666 RepID=UPI0039A639EF